MAKFSTQDCVFIVKFYYKLKSARKFQCTFSEEVVPFRRTIYSIVGTFEQTGSVLHKKMSL